MFLPIQHAAARALESPLEWHRKRDNIYLERRTYAWKILDLLDCKFDRDQVGMFVWAKIPDAIEDVEVFIDELLYDARVFITPGKIFGSNGDRYIRISLCMEKSIIQEAHDRIEKMLEAKSAKA